MSYLFTNDFSNIKENTECVEINNIVKNKLRNGAPNENVEIFSKIVWGKDTSGYGKKVDNVVNAVKNMATAAKDGDIKAKAELNSITTVTLQQPLMKRLQLNNMLGNVTTVGLDEDLHFEYYQLQGEMSRKQAASGAFPFPTVKKKTESAETKNATGGLVVDYRELASGAFDGFTYAGEQVVTDITNQMVSDHLTTLQGIQKLSTIKNYAAGITSTNVDKVTQRARRFGGNVTLMGDIAALSKLNDFIGFDIKSATAGEVRYPEAVMEEIMRTGLIKNYKGILVAEIPNAYNMTELNTEGDFYKPYLPTTDLWVIPRGKISPLQIVMRSGLITMTVQDINIRSEVTRFDLEYGNKLLPELVPMIGNIYDESLAE